MRGVGRVAGARLPRRRRRGGRAPRGVGGGPACCPRCSLARPLALGSAAGQAWELSAPSRRPHLSERRRNPGPGGQLGAGECGRGRGALPDAGRRGAGGAGQWAGAHGVGWLRSARRTWPGLSSGLGAGGLGPAAGRSPQRPSHWDPRTVTREAGGERRFGRHCYLGCLVGVGVGVGVGEEKAGSGQALLLRVATPHLLHTPQPPLTCFP